MQLIDLDPHWIVRAGVRLGFVFRSPTRPDHWQSCFVDPPKVSDQLDLFDAILGETEIVQPCNPAAHWSIAGGIEAASFETMTVTPSLDGSAGGLWHGFITGGAIVGGVEGNA